MVNSNIIHLFAQTTNQTCLKEIVCVCSKSRHSETIHSIFIWGHCETVDVVEMEEEHSSSAAPEAEPEAEPEPGADPLFLKFRVKYGQIIN